MSNYFELPKPVVYTFFALVSLALIFLVLLTLNVIPNAPTSCSRCNKQPTAQYTINIQNLTTADRLRIEEWIKSNGLNQYGDAQGTVYTGGTPLFNEATGQSVEKYQYILNRHPNLITDLGLSQ